MKNLFYVLALFLIMGCGARKSNTTTEDSSSNTDIAAASETSTDLQQNSSIEVTDIKYKQTITETQKTSGKATPINPDKPLEVIHPDGSKTSILNGTWEAGSESTKTETKEKETTHLKDTIATSAKQVNKSAIKATVKTKDSKKAKATDREQFNYFPYIVAIVLLSLIWFFILKHSKDEKAKNIPSGSLE